MLMCSCFFFDTHVPRVHCPALIQVDNFTDDVTSSVGAAVGAVDPDVNRADRVAGDLGGGTGIPAAAHYTPSSSASLSLIKPGDGPSTGPAAARHSLRITPPHATSLAGPPEVESNPSPEASSATVPETSVLPSGSVRTLEDEIREMRIKNSGKGAAAASGPPAHVARTSGRSADLDLKSGGGAVDDDSEDELEVVSEGRRMVLEPPAGSLGGWGGDEGGKGAAGSRCNFGAISVSLPVPP